MDLYREDARVQKHIFRPNMKVDREHAPNYSMTDKEKVRMDAHKFKMVTAMQLRDLFATV